MQTASIVSQAQRRGVFADRLRTLCMAMALGLGLLELTGCAGSATVVHDDLLAPIAMRRPWLPGPADRAAARLARAALIARPGPPAEPEGPPTVDPAVEEALDALRAEPDNTEGVDLTPLAIDLRNATLDDPIADRAASRKLSRRRGLDPRLKSRLDRLIRDDPLRLAGRRRFDGWHRLWARTFNAVVEPIGSSAITGFVLAPYQLANSLIHYFADFSNSEPLSSTDRQALALREEYVERNPDLADTPGVEAKIERDLPKLDATFAKRSMRAADQALKVQAWDLALFHAESAKTTLERHPASNQKLMKRADSQIETARAGLAILLEQRRLSLGGEPGPESLAPRETQLAAHLLITPTLPLEIEFTAPDQAPPDSPLQDERFRYIHGRSEYLRALAQHEAGFESGERRRLTRAARGDGTDDTMARHARVLLDDDWQNPLGAFHRLARKATRDEIAWRLAGEWVRRPRYPNLPAPVAYLIDLPTIAITIILAPLRLMISPWMDNTPDFRRGAALAGYRYLIRYPDGEDQPPVVEWLYQYELDQKRYARALRMADWIPEFDPAKRAELVEKTAEESLAQAAQLERRDERSSILRGVAREFPDSAGGRTAGLRARSEQEDASPQNIRITRGFLIENPEVAGPEGVGLNPVLLDDDPSNGELHPEGIVLRGGRMLEVRLVAEGGDKDDPPASRFVEISEQRLRQLAVTIDEAVQRNGLIDADSRFDSDPRRDHFMERAALGLTDEPDMRATAESSFVYQSLRERYGMVRGRDSVLPFDLVFRGSLGDFTLGAFPRWRMPRETPDAYLYR
jgi:hypothetical protein